MTRLDEALGSRLLPALITVKAEALDALHLILPLLADNLEQAFGADVFLLVLTSWSGGSDSIIGGLRPYCSSVHVGIII